MKVINPTIDYAALRRPNVHFLTSERTTAAVYCTQPPAKAGSWRKLEDKTLLFNLADDPLEMTNLADDPQWADQRQQLTRTLHKLQLDMDDPLQ